MKYAFDFTSAVKAEPTGIARYVVEILRAMLLQMDAQDRVVLGYRFSRWHRREHAPKFNDPRVSVRPLQSPFAFLTYGSPDVFHGLGVNVPKGLPRKTRKFVTIHGFISSEEVAPGKRDAYLGRLAKIQRMLTRADRGFVVSRYELQRTSELCQCPPEKLKAIYHGVDHTIYHANGDPAVDRAVVDARLSTIRGATPGRPYLMCLGAITNRKNVPLLLDAFDRSKCKQNYDLILAGQVRSESPEILKNLSRPGLAGRVHHIGHVSHVEIPAWLRTARALVHPSQYESFGLPLIEGMACGAPVACSNTSAMPEITGGASLLFTPDSAESVAGAIDTVASDDQLCATLKTKGVARAAEFTWERAALETFAAYREAGVSE